jgi:hypothetical protein
MGEMLQRLFGRLCAQALPLGCHGPGEGGAPPRPPATARRPRFQNGAFGSVFITQSGKNAKVVQVSE